jgi:hypothetical protein
MKDIRWRKNITIAKNEALKTGKPILLFFHHPNCSGCKKTIKESLTDQKVINIVGKAFIPVTYLVTESEKMVKTYHVDWTPTFMIADEEGRELERWIGYLPLDDFLAQIQLSEGLASLHRERYVEAEKVFERIISEHSTAEVVPEAHYFLGVSHYKESGDVSYLKGAWETMKTRFPDNSWTKRASAWA